MEVILKEDYPALGFIGDRISVKRGYARNYLLPRGLAIEANDNNARHLKHSLSAITSKRIKLRSEAETVATDIQSKNFEFTLKAGEGGKIFGAVTVMDIEAELSKNGFKIDRRRIRLGESLKKAGNYQVDVKLHPEVTAPLNVSVKLELVEPTDASAKGGEASERKEKRAPRSKKPKQDNEEEKAE